MMRAFKSFWRNGFNFSGRTSVGDYWTCALITLLVVILMYVGVCFSAFIGEVATGIVFIAGIVYSLAAAIPSFSIIVRRLHDTNRCGWWYFIGWIPFGGLVLLIFLCLPSVEEGNRYGTTQV